MKKQTKSNLQNSLQTLGLIFLIFFAMAFACNDREDNSSPSVNKGGRKLTNGGACSTEAEFKAIITRGSTSLSRETKNTKVIFNSFDLKGPMQYKNYEEYYVTNTDNAYRVTTDFDVIYNNDELGAGKTFRDRYENSILMCYTVTSKNTCVCFGEKNSLPKARWEDVTGQY